MCMFQTPKMPAPAAPVVAPAAAPAVAAGQDAQVEQVRANTKKRAMAGVNQSSSILTSPLGAAGSAVNSGGTLLGAG